MNSTLRKKNLSGRESLSSSRISSYASCLHLQPSLSSSLSQVSGSLIVADKSKAEKQTILDFSKCLFSAHLTNSEIDTFAFIDRKMVKTMMANKIFAFRRR